MVDLTETLAGGTAVITGAGSGIGKGLAQLCSSVGMNVVVAEISPERGQNTADEINAAGGSAIFVQTDVSDPASTKALAEATKAKFGGATLLVNNAGIMILGDVWDLSSDDWDRGIDINFKGVVHTTRAFAGDMITSGKTCYIANVSSMAGVCTIPHESLYIANKHAVLSLSEALYLEMKARAANVHVSVVVPGIVSTRIFEDGGAKQPKDEAHREVVRQAISAHGMPVEDAAQLILQGIASGEFWVNTHPEAFDLCAQDRARFLQERPMPRLTPNPYEILAARQEAENA